MTVRIRLDDDADTEQLIGLIGACWALYSGIGMDVDGEMPELRAPATRADAGLGVAGWKPSSDASFWRPLVRRIINSANG